MTLPKKIYQKSSQILIKIFVNYFVKTTDIISMEQKEFFNKLSKIIASYVVLLISQKYYKATIEEVAALILLTIRRANVSEQEVDWIENNIQSFTNMVYSFFKTRLHYLMDEGFIQQYGDKYESLTEDTIDETIQHIIG